MASGLWHAAQRQAFRSQVPTGTHPTRRGQPRAAGAAGGGRSDLVTHWSHRPGPGGRAAGPQ
eukprot:768392-Hanusia_phi.AAC.13